MSNRCRSCGQMLPFCQDADRTAELLAVLRRGDVRRSVYQGRDGGWWITYSTGEITAPFSWADVQRALRGGWLVETYPGSSSSFDLAPPQPKAGDRAMIKAAQEATPKGGDKGDGNG